MKDRTIIHLSALSLRIIVLFMVLLINVSCNLLNLFENPPVESTEELPEDWLADPDVITSSTLDPRNIFGYLVIDRIGLSPLLGNQEWIDHIEIPLAIDGTRFWGYEIGMATAEINPQLFGDPSGHSSYETQYTVQGTINKDCSIDLIVVGEYKDGVACQTWFGNTECERIPDDYYEWKFSLDYIFETYFWTISSPAVDWTDTIEFKEFSAMLLPDFYLDCPLQGD